jgi:6-phosphogluconolactonase/glucosamine-6-phosphate isomerase/deaminase
MKPTIRILPDANQLVHFAAQLFLSRMALTNVMQVQYTVALSGGPTQKRLFETFWGESSCRKSRNVDD